MERKSSDRAVERVVSAPQERTRQEFARFCQNTVAAVDNGDLTIEKGAFRICGTAARILDALQSNERELVTIAGNLELPVAQRDQTLPDWEDFKRRIVELFPRE